MTMAENWLTYIPATEEYIKQHNIQSEEDPILAKYPHTSYVIFEDGSRVVWNRVDQVWELVGDGGYNNRLVSALDYEADQIAD